MAEKISKFEWLVKRCQEVTTLLTFEDMVVSTVVVITGGWRLWRDLLA